MALHVKVKEKGIPGRDPQECGAASSLDVESWKKSSSDSRPRVPQNDRAKMRELALITGFPLETGGDLQFTEGNQ